MTRAFFSAAMVAASLVAMTPAAARAADRALLIGVNAYPTQPLFGPLNDVAAMERIVVNELGFLARNVLVLRDREATATAVKDAIETWLIDGTEPGDRVLFFFAGHGTQIRDGRNQDETDDGLDEALALVDFDGSAETLLLDDELAIYLDELADRRVTLIIDACHSGTVHRSMNASAPPKAARYIRNAAPVVSRSANDAAATSALLGDDGFLEGAADRTLEVWTATAPYQETFDVTENGVTQGVVTRAFVEALETGVADLDRSGKVSRNEALAHLRARAGEFCLRHGVCTYRNGAATLTPSLTAPLGVRGLEVAAWPAETAAGGAVKVADPLETLEEMVTGGGVAATMVLEHSNRKRVDALRPGDHFRARFTTDVGGDLTLYHLTEAGMLDRIFPDADFAKDTTVTADSPYLFPDAAQGVELALPEGRGAFIAIVTPDRRALGPLEIMRRTIAVRPDTGVPVNHLDEMMAGLFGIVAEGGENRGVRFGVAVARYGSE